MLCVADIYLGVMRGGGELAEEAHIFSILQVSHRDIYIVVMHSILLRLAWSSCIRTAGYRTSFRLVASM